MSRYVSLEQLIYDERDEYYTSLAASNTGWSTDGAHDLWPWTLYLLDRLGAAYERVGARISAGTSGGTKQDRVRDYVTAPGSGDLLDLGHPQRRARSERQHDSPCPHRPQEERNDRERRRGSRLRGAPRVAALVAAATEGRRRSVEHNTAAGVSALPDRQGTRQGNSCRSAAVRLRHSGYRATNPTHLAARAAGREGPAPE